ncbi:F-box protein At3g07870 [Oryza brachyantha]|uniref:F-box protein At3g07870 n=1 Tax=Oryza brachyantha TaxID=4533 RepID=UPI001ADA59A0|nr:F-box protein At3g07870 [Oryza brachyantha]
MASPEASKRGGGGRRQGFGGSEGAGMPMDVLFEILLRLPAKDICRFRAVCRSWRAMTTRRVFVRAYAARNPGPYVATSFADDDGGGESCGVDITDLYSGDVVKRIRTDVRGFRVQRTRSDLVCLVEGANPLAVTVLNPVTGATCTAAKSISDEYDHLLLESGRGSVTMDSCALGKVPSTREYKVLRFLQCGYLQQLCEVMTLHRSGVSQWRAAESPPAPVSVRNKTRSVVINGVVYFLFDFQGCLYIYPHMAIPPGCILPFDLETEEWMGIMNGPEPVTAFYKENNVLFLSPSHENLEHVSLADLNGCLATVHTIYGSCMDLWFLSDPEEGLWVKKYSLSFQYLRLKDYPLLLFDDEEIVFLAQAPDCLRSYYPEAGTYADFLDLENVRSVGIYTGNLLSFRSGFY